MQVSLAAEVAANYINLRGLQARLAIARSNLATQTETLQITRWRAQAGLVSSLDVEQAVTAAEQTRAQIPALQTSVAQALNALAVLTGQAPGALNAALGRRRADSRRRRPIWRWPFPPRRCASGPMCAPPNCAPARRWRAWRWPTPRVTPAFGSAARSACRR